MKVGVILGTTLCLVATPSYASPIVISEIEYDSVQSGTDTDFEWIELYNPTTQPIIVSGWVLEEGGGDQLTLPDMALVSGGYLLIANDHAGIQTNYPTSTPDIVTAPALRLNNGGDHVFLWDSNGIVDSVAWGGFIEDWNITTNAGESLCRHVADDTNTPSDWHSCTTPTPGSGDLSMQEDVIRISQKVTRDRVHRSRRAGLRMSGGAGNVKGSHVSLDEEILLGIMQTIYVLGKQIEALGGELPPGFEELVNIA